MPFLSEADRRALLALARKTAIDALSRGKLPEQIPNDGVFAERRGVFVTLHVRRHLRGCIGVIEADEPLGDSIVRCAASAALQDPRFPPVRQDELEELEIEISLLSPPTAISLPQIEIGRHGLLVCRGTQRGLLLPQVATEHRFTPQQFLEETCRKAQLTKEAWREPDTQVFGFTCEVFSEETPARNANLLDEQEPA
jgi:AmmeMemoRadiSam system protein A